MIDFVNAYELNPKGAPFVDLGADVAWIDVTALPQNALERAVRKPNLARLRAAVEAVSLARGRPIVSHLPRLAAAIAGTQKLRRSRSPHLAFSFNFTDLPTGFALSRFRRVLDRVDRFVTFSEFEAALYPDRFGLPRERFRPVLWAQDVPPLSDAQTAFTGQDYVCAVGGEGRDYATLAQAAALTPDITYVVIARPGSDTGPPLPNLHVLHNVPAPVTWRIAKDARVMVLPLRDDETCCGHITIVSAQLLGIPVLSTFSKATREYVDPALTCPPKDARALADLVRAGIDRSDTLRHDAAAAIDRLRQRHDRSNWATPLRAFLDGA